MSSVAEAGQGPRSRMRLGRVVLALSLTLNVFFLGGLTWSKFAAHPGFETPAQRFAELARELKLNPDQQAAFDQFGKLARSQGHALQEANEPIIDAAWAELQKPSPDEAKLAQLFEQANTNRHAFQKDVSQGFRSFLATLTPEQRQTFADLARKRHDPFAQRLWRVMVP